MHRFFRFIRELYSFWQAAWLGTVSLVIAVCLRITGHTELTWGGFAVAAFLSFVAAAYQVWAKQEVEIAKGKVVPKLFLRHVDPNRKEFMKNLAEMSGFFVQVEGPNKAFGVTVVSPDAIGKEHTRLEMLWGRINEPVGNDPVAVSALCSTKKGTSGYSEVGSQIDAYMRMKATEPKELIATITYKDVDGKECPPRRFRIYRERDISGDILTHCDLMS